MWFEYGCLFFVFVKLHSQSRAPINILLVLVPGLLIEFHKAE